MRSVIRTGAAIVCWILVSVATTASTETRHLDAQMTEADARHLLERAGIGAHPFEIKPMLSLTRAGAIDQMLGQLDVSAPFLDPPATIENRYVHYGSESDYEAADRQSFQIARNQEMDTFRQWWISELISSPNPAGERLLLLWHNHFVTAYSGLNEEVDAMIAQHRMLREQGDGNFRELLRAVIRDAAMLNYLDNSSNRKESPNENLARELLELFVLGEGNYSEQDVKEVARALTGYDYNRVRRFEFDFNMWAHDKGTKTVLGQRGAFDGDDIVDLLLDQPETATFIAETFWRAYVSEFNTDEDQLAEIASAFRESDYDIRVLLRAVLSSRAFWDSSNRGTIIKSPVDLIIGSIRTSGKLPQDWQMLPYTLGDLGQNLFEAPNVAGWPGGADWLTPARIVKRTEALTDFAEAPAWSAEPVTTPTMSTMDFANDNRIRVRYAAEDFEGPPLFSVRAFADETSKSLLWRSPFVTAEEGRDTARYGRAEGGAGLNWTIAEFTLPAEMAAPGSFQVAFINDHCCGVGGSDGGDRNLFIDWLQFNDRLYRANEGVQSPGCRGSNNSDPPGSFYCAGRLHLSTPTAIDLTETTDSEPHQGLQAGRVYYDGGRAFDRGRSYNWFSIGLDDVAFEDLTIEAMRLEVVAKRMDGRMGLAIQLNQRNCYPDCWNDRWPHSAWTNEGTPHKRVEFPLIVRTQRDSERQFRQLSDQQKRFLSALWHGLPTMMETMQEGRLWRRRDGAATLETWGPIFANFEAKLSRSRFDTLAPTDPLIIEPLDDEAGAMMGMMMASMDDTAPFVLGTLRDDLDWTGRSAASLFDDPALGLFAGSTSSLRRDFGFADAVREPAYHVK